MMQRVNLYTDELKPRREPAQASTLLWSSLALVVALVAAAVWVRLEATDAGERLQALNTQVADLEQRAQRLTAEVEAQRLDPALETALAEVNQAISQRQRLLEQVSGLVDHQDTGFSPYMAALSRQVPERLWLTGFRINLQDDSVQLTGRTRAGGQVPVYLERLGTEPVFNGRQFEQLTLQRDESGRWVEFLIGSRREGGNS